MSTIDQIKQMQHAINRFFGQLIGSPIAEDGIVGSQTTDAVNQIVSGLPGVGYSLTASTLPGEFSSGNYLQVTQDLNNVADEQNWLYDSANVQSSPTFVTGGASPSAMAPVKVVAAGGVQASLNSVASKVGLPTWALFLGAGGVAVILMTRRQRRKSKRRS